MPLWLIFHPDGTFEDDASKEAFSADITKYYTRIGLPAFYVVANFIKMPGNTMWLGGEKLKKPFIRITIDHIAVNLPNDDKIYRKAADGVDAVMKPHVADKGYGWEFHITETERRLWKIDGLRPPPFGSEGEKIWARDNRPSPWEKSTL
ncbi:putative oxalocrotonate tautomerase [Colletotrichum cereale]|nr:putative oxalocrotonate tautomerase [Colletotrichum cereale]